MSQDIGIFEFLNQEGYSSLKALELARDLLCRCGLIKYRKLRMADWKKEKARTLLKQELVLTCESPQCMNAVGGKNRVPAESQKDCEICHGSHNSYAVNLLVQEALAHNINNIVIIGGSKGIRSALPFLVKKRLRLRLIDGTIKRRLSQALSDMIWADLAVILSSSELLHSVSELYKRNPKCKIIIAHKRGIEAIANEILLFIRENAGS